MITQSSRYIHAFGACAFVLSQALCPAVSRYAPQDHQGSSLELGDGAMIWGRQTGLKRLTVPAGVTVFVKPYDPEIPESGALEIEAQEIVVLGVIDASGSGFTGGGGGAGSGGDANGTFGAVDGMDGAPGRGRYDGFEAIAIRGGSGDGPYAGKVDGLLSRDGGYLSPYSNGDDTTGTVVLLGSGGSGGSGVGYGTSDACTYVSGGRAGDGGGSGGGSVSLTAARLISIEGSVLTRGQTGEAGKEGTPGYCSNTRPPCFCSMGDGGNGGNGFGVESTLIPSYADHRGGAGAGGGLLLYCETAGGMTVTGKLDARGGRNQTSNGGTIKIFSAGPVNGLASATVTAGRVYTNEGLLAEKAEFGFEASDSGWVFRSAPPFAPPTPGYSSENSGDLALRAESTNCFGFWESKPFDVSSQPEAGSYPLQGTTGVGSLFKATFTVRSNSTDSSKTPGLRLRSTSTSLQQSAMILAESRGDGAFAPTPAGRDYTLLFSQPVGSPRFTLSFEMLNFDPADSPTDVLLLDKVVLESIPTGSLVERRHIRDYSFENGAGFWTIGGAPGSFSVPSFGTGEQGLSITGVDDQTFGYWTSPWWDIGMDSSSLFIVTFEVESSVPSIDRSRVPTFRCRLNESGFRAASMLVVDSTGDGSNSPTLGDPRKYEVMLIPSGVPAQNLLISFDYLGFHADDEPQATLYLKSVLVEAAMLDSGK